MTTTTPKLAIVAYSKASKEHAPRMRMLNESFVEGVWNVALVRLSDAQALAGEVERLRADAERYRWLRSTTNTFTNDEGVRIDVKLHPEQWDAMIDSARALATQEAKS